MRCASTGYRVFLYRSGVCAVNPSPVTPSTQSFTANSGLIDKADYLDRKVQYQAEAATLRRELDSPEDALSSWRDELERFLERGASLAVEFREGPDDLRGLLLRDVCSNHIVRDRKTASTLRFPYTLLAEWRPLLPPSILTRSNRWPDPPTVLNNAKTARGGNAMTRGLLAWWTLSDSNRRPPPCKGGALPTKLRALRRAQSSRTLDSLQLRHSSIYRDRPQDGQGGVE